MRLLHLIKSLGIGGIEKSTIRYSNILINNCDFIGIYAGKGFFDYSDFINKNIVRIFPPHDIGGKRFFIQNLIHLISTIKKYQINIIHYHHRIYIPFVLFVKFIFPNIKIIYTHHSCFGDIANHFILADNIIALNQSTKKDLPKKFHEKTVIIPHGIKIKIHGNFTPSNPKTFGYVGRFVNGKGLLELLNEFKYVNSKIPESKLIFVGDGPLKKRLNSEISRLELTGKVEFQNPCVIDEDIYSNIDILVVPSQKLEGFGLVTLEANAIGVIALVSNIGSFRERIIDKNNGLIYNDNLSKTMLKIIDDKLLFEKIRRSAFETVKLNFDVNVTIEKYIKLIYN